MLLFSMDPAVIEHPKEKPAAEKPVKK